MSIWRWCGVIAICLFPSVAMATPPTSDDSAYEEASADALFEQASEAMERGDYAAARAKLTESNRLDPAAGTLFNLAECDEQLADLEAAAQHWRAALSRMSATDERRPEAERRLAALETKRKVPLDTSTTPGQPLPPPDPSAASTAQLGPAMGQSTTPGPMIAPPPIAAPTEPSFLSRHRFSLATAGVSVGLFAAGVALGARTVAHFGELEDQCTLNRPGCTEDERTAIGLDALGTNMLLGFAAAGALTAGVLFLAIERPRRPSPLTIAASPAGVTLSWTY